MRFLYEAPIYKNCVCCIAGLVAGVYLEMTYGMQRHVVFMNSGVTYGMQRHVMFMNSGVAYGMQEARGVHYWVRK